MVGKETVAILLGEKRLLRLLFMLLAILIPITPLGSLLKAISPLGFALTLCPIYILIIFLWLQNPLFAPGNTAGIFDGYSICYSWLIFFFLNGRFSLHLN